jgi:hypothetical protein
VGFVVDKVAMGQFSLRVLQFLLSISFHHGSPCSYIICGMNNRPTGGRSSETQCHPIDMNGKQRQSLPDVIIFISPLTLFILVVEIYRYLYDETY